MWETFNSKEKTLHIRTNYASADFLKKLNHFRKVNAFTDVILRQENVKIPAHKIVLSCVSPYFEAMFNGNFKENQENQHEIQIGGVSDSALVSIIDYFYTGSVIVTMDNAEELLEISDILLLEETKKSILRFLKDTMNYSNCLIHKYLGSIYCDENLVESANSYFCRNFEAVSQTQQFLQIPTFEELFQLLEDCVITVKSEEIVRRGIKKWVEFDTTNRQQYLEKFTSLNIAINSITKMLIAIGYDSQDVEYLDLNDLKNGWKVLTK